MLLFFFKGFMIGLAIAAPVGPIGVLCIRRTLLHGMRAGLATGAGAAVADATYGAVAAFGLTAVSGFLQQAAGVLQLLGGGFLIYLAVRTLRQPPAAVTHSGGQVQIHSWRDAARDFTSTVFLTLTNPATILSFVAIFAGLGLVQGAPGMALPSLMVLGVFLGSLGWWVCLSGGIALLRHRLGYRGLKAANLLSGGIIGAFGVFSLAHFIYISVQY